MWRGVFAQSVALPVFVTFSGETGKADVSNFTFTILYDEYTLQPDRSLIEAHTVLLVWVTLFISCQPCFWVMLQIVMLIK